MKKLLQRIQQQVGHSNLIENLADRLTGTDFNSLMLAVFRRRAQQLSPGNLLRAFSRNRFVRPVDVDALQLKSLELDCLQRSQLAGFSPLLLSPLTPLATCAALGASDQNRTVSALRGTEVVSDATNVLALQIAQDVRKRPNDRSLIRYSTSHRHVRAQSFDHPLFTAHFMLWCLVTGGFDPGNFQFELDQLVEHLRLHHQILPAHFERKRIHTYVYLNSSHAQHQQKLRRQLDALTDSLPPIEFISGHDRENYYESLRFKIFLDTDDGALHLVDGGTVNWTQQLLSNRKHRLFISASGLEVMCRVLGEPIGRAEGTC